MRVVTDDNRVEQQLDTTGLRHIAASRGVYACGAPRDEAQPIKGTCLDEFDCVVCVDLWLSTGPWRVQ